MIGKNQNGKLNVIPKKKMATGPRAENDANYTKLATIITFLIISVTILLLKDQLFTYWLAFVACCIKSFKFRFLR